MLISFLKTIQWQNPFAFYTLIPIFVAVIFFISKQIIQIHQKKILSEKMANRHTVQHAFIGTIIRVFFFTLACIFAVFALARPSWKEAQIEAVHKQGRDVIFLLDVSKSMLAEDVIPSRLERAKLLIQDTLPEIQGGRVGLILFAGEPILACPLTNDIAFFRTAINRASYLSVNYGGTNFGKTLKFASEFVFDKTNKTARDIILITDGGNHDKESIKQCESIVKNNIRLITIGIGDPLRSSPIPIRYSPNTAPHYQSYNGSLVKSKLEPEILREITKTTKYSQYFQMGADNLDLAQIYRQHTKNTPNVLIDDEGKVIYQEEFQLFLSFSIICFFLALLLPTLHKSLPTTLFRLSPILVLSFLISTNSYAQDKDKDKVLKSIELKLPDPNSDINKEKATQFNNEGNRYLSNNQLNEAENAYKKAYVENSEQPLHLYNLATVYSLQKRYQEAYLLYDRIAPDLKDKNLQHRAITNSAICAFKYLNENIQQIPAPKIKQLKEFKQFLQQNVIPLETLIEEKNDIDLKASGLKEIFYQNIANLEKQEEQQKQQNSQNQKDLKEILQKQQELTQENRQEQQKQQEQQQGNKEQQEQQSQQQGNGPQEQQNQDQQQQAQQNQQQGNGPQEQQMSTEQKQLSKKTEKVAQKMKQQKEIKDILDQVQKSQEQASDQLKDKKLSNAEQKQLKAEEDLMKALEKLREDSEESEEGGGDPEQGEEADSELQDELNRMKKRDSRYHESKDVDKDW